MIESHPEKQKPSASNSARRTGILLQWILQIPAHREQWWEVSLIRGTKWVRYPDAWKIWCSSVYVESKSYNDLMNISALQSYYYGQCFFYGVFLFSWSYSSQFSSHSTLACLPFSICFLLFLNTFLHKIDFKIFWIPFEVFCGACYSFLKTEAFEKCRL